MRGTQGSPGEQFVEEPPKQVVALAFRGIGDPFRNALDALPALAVARVSKQQVVQPAENCGEFGVGARATVRFGGGRGDGYLIDEWGVGCGQESGGRLSFCGM